MNYLYELLTLLALLVSTGGVGTMLSAWLRNSPKFVAFYWGGFAAFFIGFTGFIVGVILNQGIPFSRWMDSSLPLWKTSDPSLTVGAITIYAFALGGIVLGFWLNRKMVPKAGA
jgi:hypothetical protein